jgi:hypothetical protein
MSILDEIYSMGYNYIDVTGKKDPSQDDLIISVQEGYLAKRFRKDLELPPPAPLTDDDIESLL